MKKTNVLTISYDWNDTFGHKPEEAAHKIGRDHLDRLGNSFFSISWSKKSYHAKIGNNVETVHLRGRVGRFRPLYDLITPFLTPFILKRHSFTPDVVALYDAPLLPSTLYSKWVQKAKIIFFITNLPEELAQTRSNPLLRSWYIRLFQMLSVHIADKVYVINETTKEYAKRIGFQKDDIVMFSPDTIKRDASFISGVRKGVIRQEYGISADTKVILSVGRLEAEKRFDLLIRLFASLKNQKMTLIIVGDGTLRQPLEDLATELRLNDRVIFAGYQSRERIWNFYRDADLFMLFSLSEALGLVFWEAMYMGIPVIGSRASGIAETIGRNGERGFLYEPEDGQDALEARVKEALSSESSGMIRRARDYAAQKAGFPADEDVVS